MRFNIVEQEDLSGGKAHIYSVRMEGEEYTLLEQFFMENTDIEYESLKELRLKIKAMGNLTGCRKEYFKEGEGTLADGVVALRYGHLRIYAIYFNKTVVLFGSGGYKAEGIRAYQDDPKLNKKAQQVRQIATVINKAIRDKDIVIEENGIINDDNFECYE